MHADMLLDAAVCEQGEEDIAALAAVLPSPGCQEGLTVYVIQDGCWLDVLAVLQFHLLKARPQPGQHLDHAGVCSRWGGGVSCCMQYLSLNSLKPHLVICTPARKGKNPVGWLRLPCCWSTACC